MHTVQSARFAEQKDSIRGVNLLALAEKDLGTISVTFPEEITPTEETKDSLSGGAPLPILAEKKTKNPEAPESTSDETEKNPFIRAKCDETTTADTYNAVCENPVIRAECDGTAFTHDAPTPEQMQQLVRHAPAPNASGEVVIPKIPEWLLKQYEEARKRYSELYKDDQLKAAKDPKKAEEAPVIPDMPEPGTTEYYQRKLENTRKAFPELCQPVKGPVSVSSLMGDVLAGIKKPGKSSGGGSPKDRYSPDYAPEVMRPTAEYLLCKTGRKGLRWKEIEILRELSAIHYPTVVNKEIRRACERFEKKNEPLECLTMMYIAVGLRKWRSFGKKKAKSYTPTAEEKAQRQADVRARIAELKEKLGIERDEEGNWIERKREDKT